MFEEVATIRGTGKIETYKNTNIYTTAIIILGGLFDIFKSCKSSSTIRFQPILY